MGVNDFPEFYTLRQIPFKRGRYPHIPWRFPVGVPIFFSLHPPPDLDYFRIGVNIFSITNLVATGPFLTSLPSPAQMIKGQKNRKYVLVHKLLNGRTFHNRKLTQRLDFESQTPFTC